LVHVGGVDEIAPAFDEAPDDRRRFLLSAAPVLVTEGHGAEADARDEQARVAEIAVFHNVLRSARIEQGLRAEGKPARLPQRSAMVLSRATSRSRSAARPL